MITDLTEPEVRTEVDRLLALLEWWRTDEGIEWHTVDKNTATTLGVAMPMMEMLVDDAIDHGYDPAYVFLYLALRVWGHSDDVVRERIEAAFGGSLTKAIDRVNPRMKR